MARAPRRTRGKHDRALLAILLACGVRHEAVNLDFGHIQQREEHSVIIDLKGKAGHTRTMSGWPTIRPEHRAMISQNAVSRGSETGRDSRLPQPRPAGPPNRTWSVKA